MGRRDPPNRAKPCKPLGKLGIWHIQGDHRDPPNRTEPCKPLGKLSIQPIEGARRDPPNRAKPCKPLGKLGIGVGKGVAVIHNIVFSLVNPEGNVEVQQLL